jgi:hypothetical protein
MFGVGSQFQMHRPMGQIGNINLRGKAAVGIHCQRLPAIVRTKTILKPASRTGNISLQGKNRASNPAVFCRSGNVDI